MPRPILFKLQDVFTRGVTPLRPGKMPLTSIQAIPWTPALLPPRAWYKADELQYIDSATVTSWTDSSGNGLTPTTFNTPSLKQAFLNSKNVVEFTNADSDYFTIPAGVTSGLAEGSVFFVAKRKSDPGTDNGPVVAGAGTSGSSDHYPFNDANIYDGFLSTVRKTVGDPGDLSQWHLGSFQSKASDYRYAFNATDFFTTATNTVGASGAGWIGTNGTHYFDGYIAEIVFYSSFLATVERQQVEGYLAWKWGLQANLPVGHPYYTAPPTFSLGGLSGSSALSFTPSATATGTGALSGASSLTFTPAVTLTGLAPITGSSSLTFSQSSTLTGKGALSGASSLTFAPSGAITGSGALTGASTLVFTPSGAITGKGALSGTAALSFTPSATITGLGALSGASSLTFAPSGTVTGTGALSGTSLLSFSPSGTLAGSAPGVLVGTASITFAPSGTLSGVVYLAGVASLNFGASGTLTAFDARAAMLRGRRRRRGAFSDYGIWRD